MTDSPDAHDGEANAPTSTHSLPLIAALAAFVVFLPSLLGGYVFDDVLLIQENEYAHGLSYLLRGFGTHLWDVASYGTDVTDLRYYRPLVTGSYVLNWVVSGGTAWSFHLFNVACHAAATLLATRLATRFTGNRLLGFAIGLLFALHSCRAETVIWISGRTDLLMVLFALLGADVASSAVRAQGARAFVLGALAVACGALAILSKEGGVVAPLLLFGEWQSVRENASQKRRLLAIAGTTGALSVSYVVLRAIFYPLRPPESVALSLRHGFVTVWGYVERVLFPWPQTFFVHPLEMRDGLVHYGTLPILLGALAAAGYLVLSWQAWRCDRAAFALLLTAALALAPLLHFTEAGNILTPADHFLYLPLFCFLTGVVRLYRSVALDLATLRVAHIAFFGLLTVHAALDVVRVPDFRNDETLFRHELTLNPDNPVALAAMARLDAHAGDLEGALVLAKRAISPQARRFFLLSGDSATRNVMDARALALEAALTADGNVLLLEDIFRRLHTLLVTKETAGQRVTLDPEELSARIANNGRYAAVAADTLLVASRLGGRARVAEWLDALPAGILWQVPSPLNLVLAYARIGEFSSAKRLIASIRAAPAFRRSLVPEPALAGLEGRIGRAEQLLGQGPRFDSDADRARTATALADLGAYLRALRVLRPAMGRSPRSRELAPLYVQLLLCARLDEEALRTAAAVLGPEEARVAIEQMRGQLNPAVLLLRKPPEPSPW